MGFQIKRIYEAPSPQDGTRILVDRLWPRGMAKERATLDAWLKEVAPDVDLRRWFGHKPERFDEFRAKYIMELEQDASHRQAVARLLELGSQGLVTLLYAAKSTTINHAAVLKDYLDRQTAGAAQGG